MERSDNIYTYMKWRGDLLLRNEPFNEVDALILSELSYIQFEGIVAGVEEDGLITIEEANKKYIKKNIKAFYYAQKETMFDKIAECPRYKDLTLCNYVSTLDTEAQQQFAAIHVNLGPNLTFIGFRGTDSSVVGWREDFNMSYLMPVPAQQSAVEYVNRTAKGLLKKYWLGGHSKGGNLAIYSGVFCHPKIQKKLVGISSFDGPGFHRTVVDEPAYKAVEDRICAYVPVSSVVGMLMEHEEEYKVVKSTQVSLLQHEGFSWQVHRNGFVLEEEVDKNSMRMSLALKEWLKKVSHEERKVIVDAFFGVLEQAGIQQFEELLNPEPKKVAALLKAAAAVPKEERDLVGKMIKLLVEESTKK